MFGCYILFDVCVCDGVSARVCVCVCARFPCGCKSPDWHVGSVGKQQVWDTLMAFTDGFRALPMGGPLLHLLIYSFSTAEETLRPVWLFPRAKVPREQLGCFLIQSPLILSPPHSASHPVSLMSPCPLFPRMAVLCMCVFCGSNLITPMQLANWQALNVCVIVSLCHCLSVSVGYRPVQVGEAIIWLSLTNPLHLVPFCIVGRLESYLILKKRQL